MDPSDATTTHFANFHNADAQGRVRLTCNGTIRDLGSQNIALTEGLTLTDDDELEADGTAHFSGEEQDWVAVIDWKAIRPHVPSPP